MNHRTSRDQRSLVLVLAAALALAAEPRAEEPRLVPCQRQVDDQLRAWSTVSAARQQPSPGGAATVKHWPTETLGTWVIETADEHGVALTRVNPETITRVAWSTTCESTVETRARPKSPGVSFSDADLEALLRSRRRGVLYIWSPHMPLSVDGLVSLSSAGSTAGLDVTVLLDAGADRGFARRTAAAAGWPEANLRVVDSIELQFRDALVHAPALVMYGGGRIVGSVLPGVHTTAEYASLFVRLGMAPHTDVR